MRTTFFRLFSVFLIAALLLTAQGARPTAAAGGTTYVVDSLADTIANDGACTLREAIQEANNGADTDCAGSPSPNDDIITFNVSGTITLSSTLPNIVGGQGTLTIDGDSDGDFFGDITISGNNSVQVMVVDFEADLTLNNITIADGYTTSSNGGGIFNNGTLTVTNSTFSNNRTINSNGGGIYNYRILTVTNSTFSNNSANNGGGIHNRGSGTLMVTNSTFYNNSATNWGGGIGNEGILTVTNSTFSNNSAKQYGGGIFNNGTLTVTNSTFSNNRTINTSGGGGGIYNYLSGTLALTNTIIANSPYGGDCMSYGAVDPASKNNLIEDSTKACGLTNGVNGNIIGVDPSLGALTDFGGPGKQVFPLLSSSPAIDAGTNTGCPAADQRGAARPTDGNGDGAATCDIGAYETDAAVLVTPGAGGGNGPGGVGITDGSSSLELWLKADAGVTTSGSSVSTWADQSGHGADVTQGSATSQPTHVTSLASLNNQPAVQFDGSNDYLNIPASVIEGKTAFSFFTAFQWNGGNAWQRLWDFGSNTTYNGFVTTRNEATNTPRFAITTSGALNEERLTFSSALPTGSGQMIDVVWNVPNGGGWRNGTSEASGASYTLTPNSLGTITQHYIGKSIYSVDAYLNAYIGDYIVFSTALNDTERILVENYLSAKYNVALSANDVYDGDDNANGDFDLNVAGIGQFGGNKHTQAHAAGMIVVDRSFLNDDGDWLLFGHNVAANSNVTTDLPTTGDWATAPNPQRWARSFYIDVTDNTTGADCATPGTCLVDIIFDFSEGGMGNGKPPAGPTSNYRLLKRTGTTGQFSDIATATAIVGDQVQFLGVDVSLLGSNFTLGTLDSGTSPTAVTLNAFEAHVTGAPNTWPLVGMSAILLGVVSLALVRKRRQ